jgi:hypothetical protein
MNDDKIYTPGVKTDIGATFRRLGWTPPSEDPATVAKWEYYRSLAMRSYPTADQASSATAY